MVQLTITCAGGFLENVLYILFIWCQNIANFSIKIFFTVIYSTFRFILTAIVRILFFFFLYFSSFNGYIFVYYKRTVFSLNRLNNYFVIVYSSTNLSRYVVDEINFSALFSYKFNRFYIILKHALERTFPNLNNWILK